MEELELEELLGLPEELLDEELLDELLNRLFRHEIKLDQPHKVKPVFIQVLDQVPDQVPKLLAPVILTEQLICMPVVPLLVSVRVPV